MQLIPQAAVVGLIQSAFPDTGLPIFPVQPHQTTNRDTINRVWADVVQSYPNYQSLQFDPSGKGAAFIGESGPDDLVLLRPPLFQVRSPVGDNGVPTLAKKAAFILKIALHYFSGPPPINLGVKLIYSCPAPGNDAKAFIRTELIKGDEDYAALSGSQNDLIVGVMVVAPNKECTHTLNIQPLRTDNNLLYVDLDTQFVGQVEEQKIEERVLAANDFLTTHVNSFLDKKAGKWSTQ